MADLRVSENLTYISNNEAEGSVTIHLNDEPYYVVPIIDVGDLFTSSADRKITRESSLRTSTERKKCTITIKVTRVRVIDASHSEVHGIISSSSNNDVQRNTAHVFTLTEGMTFTLNKTIWTQWHLLCLKDMQTDKEKSTMVIMIVEGIAQFYLVRHNGSFKHLTKVTKSIPRKNNLNTNKRNTEIEKFVNYIFEMAQNLINENVSPIIIATSRNNVYSNMLIKLAEKNGFDRKIVSESAPGASFAALKDLIKSPVFDKHVTSVEKEEIENFVKDLTSDYGSERAIYGESAIWAAYHGGNLEKVIVSWSKLYSKNVTERDHYRILLDGIEGVKIIIANPNISEPIDALGGITGMMYSPDGSIMLNCGVDKHKWDEDESSSCDW